MAPVPDARLKVECQWSRFTFPATHFPWGRTETLGGSARLSEQQGGCSQSLSVSDSKTQAFSRLLSKLLPENLTRTSYSSYWIMNLTTKEEVLGGWEVGVGNS